MFVLKLRKIGTDLGIVLPKKMLNHLDAGRGRELFAVAIPGGYSLVTLNKAQRKQVGIGGALIDRYSDAFESMEIAKKPPDLK